MKTKIYYGRDLIGRFTCDGSKRSEHKEAKRFIRNSIIALFVLGAGFGITVAGYKVGALSNVQIALAEKEVDVTDARFAMKIEAMKMELVDQLMQCESPGYKDSDGLITYDPQKGNTVASKIPSIGRLQFKVSTVIHYEKTLHNAVLTPTEAIKLALDTEKSKVLARDIMFKSNNKANDWLNCATKLDLNKKIDLIKQLEK